MPKSPDMLGLEECSRGTDEMSSGMDSRLDVYDYVMQKSDVKQKSASSHAWKTRPIGSSKSSSSKGPEIAAQHQDYWSTRAFDLGQRLGGEQVATQHQDDAWSTYVKESSKENIPNSSERPKSLQASSSDSASSSSSLQARHDWLLGTYWIENAASYLVGEYVPAARDVRARFQATKYLFGKHRSVIPLFVDEQGQLIWGEKAKWYAREVNERGLVWVEKISGKVANVWRAPAEHEKILHTKTQNQRSKKQTTNWTRRVETASSGSSPTSPQRRQDEQKPRWADEDSNSDHPEEDHPAPEGEEPFCDERREWTQYRNHEGNLWWWHRSARFFYVGDPQWQQFTTPEDSRLYWWNEQTDEYFFEDTGCTE